MFTPQEVFNKVMEWRLYPHTEGVIGSSDYMCVAIKVAYQSGLISKEPCVQAVEAINEYIKDSDTMFIFLSENEYPTEVKDHVAIYKDWGNRPKFDEE